MRGAITDTKRVGEGDPDYALRAWAKKEDAVVFKSVDSREKSFELSSSANNKGDPD